MPEIGHNSVSETLHQSAKDHLGDTPLGEAAIRRAIPSKLEIAAAA